MGSGVHSVRLPNRPFREYSVLTVTTANVNGIRAASRKGFDGWLTQTKADVVCLQEVRAELHEVPATLLKAEGWHEPLFAPAAAKGRAGVALYSRAEPLATRIGFSSLEFDASGRYAEIDLPGLTVASLYLPSGDVDTPRQEEKLRFMAEFLDYLKAARSRAEAAGRELVVCGDWNIAHREADLKNWKTNQRTSGFLPEEREWLSRVFDEAGYVDVVRALHPEGPGPYSWWSYRGRAFDNDAGWRIDYQIATPGLAKRAVSAEVERAATHLERWSDHAPVTVTFDV
jgi:exodeoxyribonuclease-3